MSKAVDWRDMQDHLCGMSVEQERLQEGDTENEEAGGRLVGEVVDNEYLIAINLQG